MTALERLKAGHPFRNGDFPDSGFRYKLRLSEFSVYDIVPVGDEYFDLQGHTASHYVKRFDSDVVVCANVMREMEGNTEVLTFLVSSLIFDEIQ